MFTTIAKDFHWEMSHRLPYHLGGCKNIHGHSYKMRLELSGYVNDNGMLIDFYDINDIVMPFLDKLDHSFLCDSTDELMINFLKDNEFKHYIIPKFSTVEHITEYVANYLAEGFRRLGNIQNIKVRIWETEDAYAENHLSLM